MVLKKNTPRLRNNIQSNAKTASALTAHWCVEASVFTDGLMGHGVYRPSSSFTIQVPDSSSPLISLSCQYSSKVMSHSWLSWFTTRLLILMVDISIGGWGSGPTQKWGGTTLCWCEDFPLSSHQLPEKNWSFLVQRNHHWFWHWRLLEVHLLRFNSIVTYFQQIPKPICWTMSWDYYGWFHQHTSASFMDPDIFRSPLSCASPPLAANCSYTLLDKLLWSKRIAMLLHSSFQWAKLLETSWTCTKNFNCLKQKPIKPNKPTTFDSSAWAPGAALW